MFHIVAIWDHHFIKCMVAQSSEQSASSEHRSRWIFFHEDRFHQGVSIWEFFENSFSEMFDQAFHLNLASCKDHSVEYIVLFLLTSQIILHTVHQHSYQWILVDSSLLCRVVEFLNQRWLSEVLTELAFPVRMQVDFSVIWENLFLDYVIALLRMLQLLNYLQIQTEVLRRTHIVKYHLFPYKLVHFVSAELILCKCATLTKSIHYWDDLRMSMSHIYNYPCSLQLWVKRKNSWICDVELFAVKSFKSSFSDLFCFLPTHAFINSEHKSSVSCFSMTHWVQTI